MKTLMAIFAVAFGFTAYDKLIREHASGFCESRMNCPTPLQLPEKLANAEPLNETSKMADRLFISFFM